mmetsp:Transcript_83994/g.271469  ORF Transcript_83994/g.271469 Transcript_83994/m.271469 type:complete len:222 (-) Transcript_83994:52-717(-)
MSLYFVAKSSHSDGVMQPLGGCARDGTAAAPKSQEEVVDDGAGAASSNARRAASSDAPPPSAAPAAARSCCMRRSLPCAMLSFASASSTACWEASVPCLCWAEAARAPSSSRWPLSALKLRSSSAASRRKASACASNAARALASSSSPSVARLAVGPRLDSRSPCRLQVEPLAGSHVDARNASGTNVPGNLEIAACNMAPVAKMPGTLLLDVRGAMLDEGM